MSLKSRTKGAESRNRLLQCATEIFATKGYHATKVGDIVSAAGLTPPAFYLYFKSKDAIFDELVDSFRNQLRTFASKGRTFSTLTSEQVQEAMRQNMIEFFKLIASIPLLTKIAIFESSQAHEIKMEMAHLIAVNLQTNQEANHMRNTFHPGVAAQCLVGMITQVIHCWLLNGENQHEDLADQISDLFFHGIFH